MSVEVFSLLHQSQLRAQLESEKLGKQTDDGFKMETPEARMNMEDIGLTPQTILRLENFASAMEHVSNLYNASLQQGSDTLRLFISPQGRERFGIDAYFGIPLFPDGSLLRIDVLTYSGSCFVTDVNASFTGYAPHKRLSELTQTSVGTRDSVAETLGSVAVSGLYNLFITEKTYPVNSHLRWIADKTNTLFGTNYGLISAKTFHNHGNYRHFGTLIGQQRNSNLLTEHTIIYPNGSKVIEAKMLPLVAKSFCVNTKSPLSTSQEDAINSLSIPSLPIWIGSKRYPPKTVSSDDDPIRYGGRNFTENEFTHFLTLTKPVAQIACVLKLTDSSGSKKVRILRANNWKVLYDLTLKTAGTMIQKDKSNKWRTDDPEVILLQPYIPSRLAIGRRKKNIKLDTFILKMGGTMAFYRHRCRYAQRAFSHRPRWRTIDARSG